MNRLSTSKRATILQLLIERSSLRSISRVTGASINTVSKFFVDAGNACAALHDEAVVNNARGCVYSPGAPAFQTETLLDGPLG